LIDKRLTDRFPGVRIAMVTALLVARVVRSAVVVPVTHRGDWDTDALPVAPEETPTAVSGSVYNINQRK